jgi:putative ABC transport system permease protein
MTERRTKEIGIRKVSGSKSIEIFSLLSKEYVTWVIISILIGSPVAWYAMNRWLQNFAYRINMSWWVFALAGIIVLAIAMLTVSWQSYRAANKNPVDALRYE